MATGITYYCDCRSVRSITNPIIGNNVKMKYNGTFIPDYPKASFDSIYGLKKTKASQGIIYCDDASKLFSTSQGYVGINLKLPYHIVNGIYSPLRNTDQEYLLWGVNVGRTDVSFPSVSAKLTSVGIEFTILSSVGTFTLLDIYSNIYADTNVFFEFVWGNERLDDFSLEDFDTTMAIRVNGEDILLGNPPARYDLLTNLNFCVLETPFTYNNLECTLNKLIISNILPSWLEDEWYSSSSESSSSESSMSSSSNSSSSKSSNSSSSQSSNSSSSQSSNSSSYSSISESSSSSSSSSVEYSSSSSSSSSSTSSSSSSSSSSMEYSSSSFSSSSNSSSSSSELYSESSTSSSSIDIYYIMNGWGAFSDCDFLWTGEHDSVYGKKIYAKDGLTAVGTPTMISYEHIGYRGAGTFLSIEWYTYYWDEWRYYTQPSIYGPIGTVTKVNN